MRISDTSKLFFLAIGTCLLHSIVSAQIDEDFFPSFEASPLNPIIKYGDGFVDAGWNDPCVLKEDGQYTMYLTSANGFLLSDTNTVNVYRQISDDGFHWSLSPETPVLETVPGTYYAGGVETPSVIKKDGLYHMYLTCYPPGNLASDFVIGHAISANGIDFEMDATPILESDGSETIFGDLVGEPGALVYHDSIYLFFTSAGTIFGTPMTCIAVMGSIDGTHFSEPQIAITLPTDIYPIDSGYWGLSTPSAMAINDSVYLFTDVARFINGNWTQVALHQFKTDHLFDAWLYDTSPIHTKEDFEWTNGEYLSEIRSITPILDDDGSMRIWYAGNRLADVSGADTVYHIYFDSIGGMHVFPNYWGIGTSSFSFGSTIVDYPGDVWSGNVFPNPAYDHIMIQTLTPMIVPLVSLFDVTGKQVSVPIATDGINIRLDTGHLPAGTYFVHIHVEDRYFSYKVSVAQ